MSFKLDNRGSKDQRTLYEYLHELYPNQEVVYEYYLYELNQRIDIFVPSLGIALEYNGRQHYDFIEHFHGNIEEFKRSLEMDHQKSEYLYMHGIKLVVVPYNAMVDSPTQLRELIDTTAYPEGIDYNPLPEESVKRKEFLNKQKEKRQSSYKEQKERYQEDPEDKRARLLKERQHRQEKYKKIKGLK